MVLTVVLLILIFADIPSQGASGPDLDKNHEDELREIEYEEAVEEQNEKQLAGPNTIPQFQSSLFTFFKTVSAQAPAPQPPSCSTPSPPPSAFVTLDDEGHASEISPVWWLMGCVC